MGVGEDFRSLCTSLAVPSARRISIGDRGGQIVRRLNLDFWTNDSTSAHSIYTGSYGRGTAINRTSDIDLIVWLPYANYVRYDNHSGNGQSAMLQEVRAAIRKTYPSTDIGADGQVVVVSFADGTRFEVVPAFLNTDDSFTYPDSNAGGRWRSTNPRPEIAEITRLDQEVNGNLKNLCKMARAWKQTWDVPIKGLLIDTLAYYFIRNYEYRDKTFVYYDYMSRAFFSNLANQDSTKQYWLSPGANQQVPRTGNFEYKATRCFNTATEACQYQGDKYGWTARQKWREIYGTDFPYS